MNAPRKSRSLSLVWSLPVLVAIMVFAVIELAALQRTQLINQLDERVAHGATEDATDAVRSMAKLPHPPLALLVKAAASPNLDVAREAQQAIDEYLRYCQREVTAQRSLKTVARQLAVLAESLALGQNQFPAADYYWVESTARELVRLANQLPSPATPSVAETCDRILTTIAAARSATHAPAPANGPHSRPMPHDLTPPVETGSVSPRDGARITHPPGHDERVAALVERPWGAPPASSPRGTDVRQFSVSLQSPSVSALPSDSNMLEDGRNARTYEAGVSSWKAQWSNPIFRSLPATPTQPATASPLAVDLADVRPSPTDSQQPPTVHSASSPLQDIDTRALLARWLSVAGPERNSLEQELAERGFGRPPRAIVEKLLSKQADERIAVLDDVQKHAGLNARPWIALLAEDADAEVRLAAVTVMATSHDPRLIESAWRVVLRDRDPRVAALADKLRERRNPTRRR